MKRTEDVLRDYTLRGFKITAGKAFKYAKGMGLTAVQARIHTEWNMVTFGSQRYPVSAQTPDMVAHLDKLVANYDTLKYTPTTRTEAEKTQFLTATLDRQKNQSWRR